MTDQDLLQRLQNGDLASKMELYRRYHIPVYDAAFRILREEMGAEDVCHETMITAFQRTHEVRDAEKLKAWLCTIARNSALNELKKRRKLVFEDTNLPEHQEADGDDFPEHWRVEEILKEIQRLPDGYRVVLSMHLLDGLSHEEIAKELGIAPATCRSQYLRAKARLRRQMIDSYERSTERKV